METNSSLRIAVTGSNGFLGSRLCAHLRAQGHTVFELTSRPSDGQVHFSLEKGVVPGFFRDEKIDSLIHVAYDLTQVKRGDIWRVNVEGSKSLFAQAREEGVKRVVFISTMSAYDGCRSLYGLAKLEIEAALRGSGDAVSIRPGLIYSTPLGESGGIVGTMTQKLQKSPTMPLIGSGEYLLNLSHVEDLVRFIEHHARAESEIPPRGFVTAANPRRYSFRAILELLAQGARSDSKPVRFVPLPWRAVWLGIKTAETVGLRIGFRSDSVIGLVHQDPDPDFSVPWPPTVQFRDFADAAKSDGSS